MWAYMPNVMAALPNTGDALNKSSLIPFLVPRRKVWLTPIARVLCSNGANIGERKTWKNSVRGKNPRKCLYSVSAQETAIHRAEFGWSPVSDVAALTKPRPETRCNLLGAPNSRTDVSR